MHKGIMVVAARFSNNLGDDIIFDVVEKTCREPQKREIIGLSISGRSNYAVESFPGENRSNGLKSFLKRRKIFSFYIKQKGKNKLKKQLSSVAPDLYDTIVFAGGQLFMDYFVPWIETIADFAVINNKKIIFNCCGMGKLSPQSIKALRRVLELPNVYSVTLRDGIDRYRSLNLPEAYQTIDPAFNSKEVYGSRTVNENRIGIGIISYKMLKNRGNNITEENYEKLIKEISDHIIGKGYEIKFFTNGDIEDQQYAENFVKKHYDMHYLVERPKRPVELIDIIGSCRALVSFRLHSLIVAASYSIPSIGFAWDKKVSDFFNIMGRADYVFQLEDSTNWDKLFSRLDMLTYSEKTISEISVITSCEHLKNCLSSIEGFENE